MANINSIILNPHMSHLHHAGKSYLSALWIHSISGFFCFDKDIVHPYPRKSANPLLN
jgi:hypothetical protein